MILFENDYLKVNILHPDCRCLMEMSPKQQDGTFYSWKEHSILEISIAIIPFLVALLC